MRCACIICPIYWRAGKLHAVLCRQWKNRVKGRDWYDMVWYAAHYPQINLAHLTERMRQSGDYQNKRVLTLSRLRKLLQVAIDNVDIILLKKDVLPFIRDPRELELWSKDFFYEVSEKFTE